jgi:hypothetical protein
MKEIALTKNNKIVAVIYDFIALTLVYLLPSISHMFNISLYLIEPMRIVIILSVLHTNRVNAFILAATIPIVSFLISGHPLLVKGLIMSAELSLNVYLFTLFMSKRMNPFLVAVLSIIASKIFYYIAFFSVSSMGLLPVRPDSTPYLSQILVTLAFGLYAWLMLRGKTLNN